MLSHFFYNKRWEELFNLSPAINVLLNWLTPGQLFVMKPQLISTFERGSKLHKMTRPSMSNMPSLFYVRRTTENYCWTKQSDIQHLHPLRNVYTRTQSCTLTRLGIASLYLFFYHTHTQLPVSRQIFNSMLLQWCYASRNRYSTPLNLMLFLWCGVM